MLALLLAVVLAAPQSRPGRGAAPPASARGSSTARQAASATSASPVSDPVLLEHAVSDYYALLPDNTDQAWTRLGPALQSEGRDNYEKFWSAIKDLRVVTPPRASGNTVTVSIEYKTESRGQILETHRLGMLISHGTPLINSDRLLSSQVVRGADRGRGDQGRGNGQGGGG